MAFFICAFEYSRMEAGIRKDRDGLVAVETSMRFFLPKNGREVYEMRTRELEINVRSEMLSTVDKIEAIPQLFDVGGDTSTERFTSTGFIGMAELLGGIVEEILTKSDNLNQRIEEMTEPLKDKELLSMLKMCKRSGMDVVDEFCNYLEAKHAEKAQ